MTELEALRRVAEAARAFFDAWDHGQATLGAIAEVGRALAALRALPAPAAEPEGEVVEVAVWRDNDDGEVVFCTPKTERDDPLQGWTRLDTTRLALVPEVVGKVG